MGYIARNIRVVLPSCATKLIQSNFLSDSYADLIIFHCDFIRKIICSLSCLKYSSLHFLHYEIRLLLLIILFI